MTTLVTFSFRDDEDTLHTVTVSNSSNLHDFVMEKVEPAAGRTISKPDLRAYVVTTDGLEHPVRYWKSFRFDCMGEYVKLVFERTTHGELKVAPNKSIDSGLRTESTKDDKAILVSYVCSDTGTGPYIATVHDRHVTLDWFVLNVVRKTHLHDDISSKTHLARIDIDGVSYIIDDWDFSLNFHGNHHIKLMFAKNTD